MQLGEQTKRMEKEGRKEGGREGGVKLWLPSSLASGFLSDNVVHQIFRLSDDSGRERRSWKGRGEKEVSLWSQSETSDLASRSARKALSHPLLLSGFP